MKHEFKVTKSKDQTVYTLESASSGGTSSGSVASVSTALGGVRKRGGNLLAQEAGKDKVPATTPRNFVAKNAKTSGAGAHKDKKKEQKQGVEKHKKPYMEDLKGRLQELKSKIEEIKANPDYLRAAERSRSQARDTQRQYWKSPEEKAAARHTELKRDAGIAGYSKRYNKEHPRPEVKAQPAPKYRDPNIDRSDDYSTWAAGRRDTMEQGVAEGEKTMSRAAKGHEKYGKDGMKALAKAGRDGASEKKLDAIRDKHDNYNEGLEDPKDNPCWKGYKPVGTKKKGGKTVPNCVPKEGVAEGKDDKIAQLKKDHDTAVYWSKNETSPQKREAARQKAEKIKRHLDTQYKQGVAEGYQFKGPFPFDVDHMHGGRGINLPKAETKKYFTDKKQWQRAVDDINSSKYDDNSDYIGVTGRSTVKINGREWARWSDAQQKGYIELSSMSEQGVAEGSSDFVGNAIEDLRVSKPGLDIESFLDELYYYLDAEYGKQAADMVANAGEDQHLDWYDMYSDMAESAPPGWEKTVKAMKKHDEIDNPFALAWSMKNKGYKSHKKESADPYFESLASKLDQLKKK